MSSDDYVASTAAQLQPGSIVGHDGFAIGNNGELFAVSRKCRHLGADLAGGAIDAQGCLVCPWHGAAYEVETGTWSADQEVSSARSLVSALRSS